jgi:hypothetical protein
MTRKLILFAGAVVAVFAFFLLLLFADGGFRPVTRKLPDGTVVTIEAMTYGERHRFEQGRLWRKLRRVLPPPLQGALPTGVSMTQITKADTLVVWLTCHDPATGKFIGAPWTEVALADEHGCRFASSGGGTAWSGGRQVHGFQFTAFPRRARAFKLLGSSAEKKVLAELSVPNPWFKDYPHWTPEPLPATRTNGDLVVTLQEVRLAGSSPAAVFDITGARPGSDWTWEKALWSDATGNRHEHALCTNESAWKAEATFIRLARAAFAPEETWPITNVVFPAAGTLRPLALTNRVQGVAVQGIGVAGAGEYSFTNGVFVAGVPVERDTSYGVNTSTTTSGGMSVLTLKMRAAAPLVLLAVQGQEPDQRVQVRTRDAKGRLHEATGTLNSGTMRGFHFASLAGNAPCDVEILVQRVRTVAFLVAPPRP